MKPQLQQLVDQLLIRFLQVDPESWSLTQLVYALAMIVAASIVFGFALNFAGVFIFFERRIAARMQARVGPNRVGPQGILQFVVDGLKCLFKEDLVPTESDPPLFRLSPYFVVLGMVLAFAAMPFSSLLIATDINIGILFVLGVTSLVVIGLLMGGWGSNSKWALLGGMRSAAQVVSYEIPAGIAAMTMIVIAGSLSMQDLIKIQGAHPAGMAALQPLAWGFFHSPFVAVSAVIFFIAQLAEGNRTPFDLPEAESELVSGYNTEYSGMRFLMFFLGEFANVWLLCAIPVTLYFGGWQIPWGTLADGITPAPWLRAAAPAAMAMILIGPAIPALLIALGILKYRTRAHRAIDAAEVPGQKPALTRLVLKMGLDGVAAGHLLAALSLVAIGLLQTRPGLPAPLVSLREIVAINGLQLGIFVAKTLVLVFVVIQLRWTLPRIRVDQMMTLCWKYMVPISFVCLVGTLLWELVLAKMPILDVPVRLGMAGATLLGILWYLRRIRYNYAQNREPVEQFRGQPMYYPPWRLP